MHCITGRILAHPFTPTERKRGPKKGCGPRAEGKWGCARKLTLTSCRHLEALESSLAALRKTLAVLSGEGLNVHAAMTEHLSEFESAEPRGKGTMLTDESPTGSEDIKKVKELSGSTLSSTPPRAAPPISPPSFLAPLPVQAPTFEALFGAVNCM